jgi:hypothetical protein
MKAQRDFVILMMKHYEKLSIVQIYEYFEYTISMTTLLTLLQMQIMTINILIQFY